MEQLLKKGKYNAGKRPSEHNISESGFLKNMEEAFLIIFLKWNLLMKKEKSDSLIAF